MISVVTGCTGLLGSHVVKQLQVARMPGKVIGVRRAADMPVEPCDVVYHCSGNARVYAAEQDPEMDLEANVHETLRAAWNARRCGARRFVLASSILAGDLGSAPLVAPRSWGMSYRTSKFAAELYAVRWFPFDNTDNADPEHVGIALRFSTLYGDGSRKGCVHDVVEAMQWKQGEGEAPQIGFRPESEFDLLHAGDAAAAMLLAGNLDAPTMPAGTYLATSGTTISGWALIDLAEKTFERRLPVPCTESVAPVVTTKVVSSFGLRGLGWKPQETIKGYLQKLVDSSPRT